MTEPTVTLEEYRQVVDIVDMDIRAPKPMSSGPAAFFCGTVSHVFMSEHIPRTSREGLGEL